MSEAEALASLTALGDQIFAGVDTWLALTFGYLTVAYFAGKDLTRFQCLAISALYIAGAGLYAAALPIHTHAWVILADQHPTVYDSTWMESTSFVWIYLSAALYVAGIILSLYFMHNVRARASQAD